MKYLELNSQTLTSEEPHKSSVMITDNQVVIIGVIQHCQIILPTKVNVDTLRKMADELEKRIK